jgi:aminoglycoside phosphotransferase (APT) family kinase protein
VSGPALAAAPADQGKAAKVVAWIEANVGGKVERCEAQPRWRGGWWVDVRQGGKLLNLYVREERNEPFPPWPLEHEAGALQILERHGVPVPHIYGIIGDPHATVMDNIPGDFDFAHVPEAERIAILEDFAEAVARQHAIPPEELAAQGVMAMPQTAEGISLGCFKTCEAMYLAAKKLPEPRMEFLRQWIYRNVPRHRSKVSILSVDSGQFLFRDGKVTGLYDFEYACLGDPMIDIAFIPLRLAMYNVGDTTPFLRRYAELTGETYEHHTLTFHAVWWGLCTPFILTGGMHTPRPEATYFEYIGWYLGSIASQFSLLADLKGLDLSFDYTPPPPDPSRWTPMLDVMSLRLPPQTADEPYAVTEERSFLELVRRIDAHPHLEAEYLKGVESLIGKPVGDWLEADTELEKFVLSAGPEHDDALIALFHRWGVVQLRTLFDGLAPTPMFEADWPRFSRLLAGL